MLEIINSPWKDKFFNYVEESRNEIKICSPFVKKDVVSEIYSRKNKGVKLDLVTNFNIANFYKGASDIDAMVLVLENKDKITNFQSLHAKIYLFDSKLAVITSANLTNSGLSRNFEYGVVSDDCNFVSRVRDDFESIITSQLTGDIGQDKIDLIRDLINKLPKENKIKLPKIDLYTHEEQNIDEILVAEAGTIESTLLGWKLEVFKQLCKIDNQIFELKDVYKFREDLQKAYPNNNNIDAKIRQQLQFLRDLGLIKFLSGGKYQKLWVR